ncbi:MAG: thioredoxin family protein [Pseudomonadota bacterium]
MKMSWTTTAAVLCLGALAAGGAMAQAAVNQPAPAFSVQDASGRTVSLGDYKGKHVVLEWVNPGCPFVQKHYNSGNMPAIQKDAVAKGVVWLSISSTAKDASDYKSPADLGAWQKSVSAVPTATLMDTDGKVGKAYGARTTPHMYVIDPQGKLIYAGAIDSKPTAKVDDIKGATNYVGQALNEALAGKPVSQPSTTPYGCSVKYAT